MRWVFSWGLSALTILALSACGGGAKSSKDSAESPGRVHMDFVAPGWTPEQIHIACNSKKECPPQVGLLIFTFPERNGRIPYVKCTAFLSAKNQISSNGHCDLIGANTTGYFVSSGDSRQVRKVISRIFRVFTPGPTKDDDSGRPDFGVYSLDSEITAFEPLIYADIKDPVYKELTGFVVNNGADASSYILDSIECQVRRHEALFPFDIAENPDVISAFGCGTVRGNSGGPLIDSQTGRVQAVLQGVTTSARLAEVVREKSRRELYLYERHSRVTATNLRCIGGASKACIINDKIQTGQRFSEMQTTAIEKLNSRTPHRGTPFVRYKSIPFQFNDNSDPDSLRYEVFYQPICREKPLSGKWLLSPSESVRLRFNEWGELRTEELEIRESRLTIRREAGTSVEIAAEWAEPFGNLLNAEQHPRRLWGRSFSIDLPLCAR